MPFFIGQVVQSVHHITCPVHITQEALVELESATVAWAKLPAQIHLLDFRNVKKIEPAFFQSIHRITTQLGQNNLRLASVNLNHELTQMAVNAGAANALGIIKNPLHANKREMTEVEKAEKKLWLIRYFIEATRAAIKVMFNTTVAADENYRQPAKDFPIASMYRASGIEIQSDFIKADMRLYFPKDCLESLTRSSVSIPNGPIDPEILDSAAMEMHNLIYGGAKSKLNDERQFNLPGAIPKLLPAETLIALRKNRMEHFILLPLATALGTFYMEIDIRE